MGLVESDHLDFLYLYRKYAARQSCVAVCFDEWNTISCFVFKITIEGQYYKKDTPLVFGVYLFHVNPVIWKNAIDGVASFCVDEEIVVGVIYILGLAAIVFICGIIVEAVRRQIFKLLKIHSLSKGIVKLFNNCVTRAETILE